MSSTKIFITGATGYIGGSVLSRLLAHPEAKSFEFTALVRSAEKAEKLKTVGVKTVIGSLYADLDLLTKSAKEADIVITIADSDTFAPAEAILKGIKQRYEETGKAPILIHTSGTAIIADDARGQHGDHTIYSDLDSDALNALPVTALHRTVDIPLIKADQEGYVKVYLPTPGTVFGIAEGPLVDIGVQHKYSIQLPLFIKNSVLRKRAGYIGAGKNLWAAASNRDTAELFVLIFDAARKSPSTAGHGKDGYYFVENLEYSGYELAAETGKVLVELGIADSAEPTPYTDEELTKYFGDWWTLLATNSRAKGDRSRALGWKPVDGKDAFIKSIRPEVLEVVKSLQAQK